MKQKGAAMNRVVGDIVDKFMKQWEQAEAQFLRKNLQRDNMKRE